MLDERADKTSGRHVPMDVDEEEAQPVTENSPIYFYDRDKPYYEFTNFSHHAIEYHGQKYPTAEHLFQTHKFLPHHPELASTIRNQSSASLARQEANRLRRLQRSDWFDINISIMDFVLTLKFEQHPDLRASLVDTAGRELIEDSPDDVFWGIGKDGSGRNELGKALMRVRDKLVVDK
ncbi:DUF1768-domain-containing protein [Amylostereum chailletii]|nr:DUF1768-domain-containing protein [Amylostereum chailletii]